MQCWQVKEKFNLPRPAFLCPPVRTTKFLLLALKLLILLSSVSLFTLLARKSKEHCWTCEGMDELFEQIMQQKKSPWHPEEADRKRRGGRKGDKGTEIVKRIKRCQERKRAWKTKKERYKRGMRGSQAQIEKSFEVFPGDWRMLGQQHVCVHVHSQA